MKHSWWLLKNIISPIPTTVKTLFSHSLTHDFICNRLAQIMLQMLQLHKARWVIRCPWKWHEIIIIYRVSVKVCHVSTMTYSYLLACHSNTDRPSKNKSLIKHTDTKLHLWMKPCIPYKLLKMVRHHNVYMYSYYGITMTSTSSSNDRLSI